MPLYKGQANLVMLAHMPIHKIEEILDQFIPVDERDTFQAQLNKIKQNGYAIGEDNNDDITTVAAPILNHYGDVVGAVNIKIKSSMICKEKEKQIIDELVSTVNKISWKLRNQK